MIDGVYCSPHGKLINLFLPFACAPPTCLQSYRVLKQMLKLQGDLFFRVKEREKRKGKEKRKRKRLSPKGLIKPFVRGDLRACSFHCASVLHPLFFFF